MKRWDAVADPGAVPGISTNYGDETVSTEQNEASWRIGNAEAVRIGVTRS